ncbi:hypothetical protein ACFL6I_15030 [candidate division KSB1 bacterium]
METFTELKPFVHNPHYHEQREKSLSCLDMDSIDRPIQELIRGFTRLSCCFTIQSCFGHFIHQYQTDPENCEPLPRTPDVTDVDYRIAYMALCIQNNDTGRALFNDLKELTGIDPEYVQFGCAEWFWNRQVNTYVLQVEPEKFKTRDRALINVHEALCVESARNVLFDRLRRIILNRDTDENVRSQNG